MGNMLESDSSGSDVENTEAHEIIRTEGDGMEFVKDSLVESISTSRSSKVGARSDLELGAVGNVTSTTTDYRNSDLQDAKRTSDALSPPANDASPKQEQDCKSNIFSRTPSTVSLGSKDQNQTGPTVDFRKVASSPRQLPSRNLLIPVKAVKCEAKTGKKSSVAGVDIDKGPQGVNKQRNAKFVPYEPYTCAIRPMVPTASKHKRKPSDSSSVVSQSSVHSSGSTTPTTMRREAGNAMEDTTIVSAGISDTNAIVLSNIKTTPERSSSLNSSAKSNINHHHNNHSAVLLRERLKIAEKEILDLQGENAKLKKLLLDSMTVSSSPSNSSFTNDGNTNHDQKESFDNLNDEIGVWRSKFLSSCVVVEQLTRDNQMLNDSINLACEILQDLKNTLPLTPVQYEFVSEWLRKNRMISNSFGTTGRQSFDGLSDPAQD